MTEATAGSILTAINAETVSEGDLSRKITGCYVSDLLSDVLSKSHEGDLWITQHTHANIVAVASVKGLAMIIVAGGNVVPEDTLVKARAEGMTIVTSDRSAFEISGLVYNMLKSDESAD